MVIVLPREGGDAKANLAAPFDLGNLLQKTEACAICLSLTEAGSRRSCG
jgi:hypothetical protein